MKESNRIEFKRQLSDDLEKEVVAFLNYREGGKLYIGIDDDIEEIDSQKSSQKILELIGEDRYITTNSMAEKLNISRRAVAKQIAILKENNYLKRIGPAKGGYWKIIKA